MIALLSGAWWVQKLTSVAAQAAALAIALAVVAAAVVGGAWWLRHDARMDERAAWKAKAAIERAGLLQAAAKRHAATLKERQAAIEASAREVDDLNEKLKELRDASPSRDKLAIPPGDPWLDGPRRLPKRP